MTNKVKELEALYYSMDDIEVESQYCDIYTSIEQIENKKSNLYKETLYGDDYE
jgi:hypothetical protein